MKKLSITLLSLVLLASFMVSCNQEKQQTESTVVKKSLQESEQQVHLPTSPAEVAQPVPGIQMTPAYVKMVGQMALTLHSDLLMKGLVNVFKAGDSQ